MTTATLYCECETPVMDVEHDAGCRRCGRPVDFSPRKAGDRHCMSCGHDFDEPTEDALDYEWADPTICPKCGSDDTLIALDDEPTLGEKVAA